MTLSVTHAASEHTLRGQCCASRCALRTILTLLPTLSVQGRILMVARKGIESIIHFASWGQSTMDRVADDLLVSKARQLKGKQRRDFLPEVCSKLCDGSPRTTEARFGWGRQTVARGFSDLIQILPLVSCPAKHLGMIHVIVFCTSLA